MFRVLSQIRYVLFEQCPCGLVLPNTTSLKPAQHGVCNSSYSESALGLGGRELGRWSPVGKCLGELQGVVVGAQQSLPKRNVHLCSHQVLEDQLGEQQ